MAGKWYPIATTKVIPPERAVYAYTIQPVRKGDLALKVEMPKGETCRRKRFELHTIRNGVFATADDKTTVHFVETDYDTFHIILFTKEDEKDLFLYVILAIILNMTPIFWSEAREEEVSDEVKEKFKNRAEELSFSPEAILYLPSARKSC
ncbi:UNVERIFIED_CONTAM: hypothetical protein K2H54_040524 [Gekko kuhli]